jgi:hypothetical protein
MLRKAAAAVANRIADLGCRRADIERADKVGDGRFWVHSGWQRSCCAYVERAVSGFGASPESMPDTAGTRSRQFFLPAGYVARAAPKYFVDEDALGRTWQPHVYPLAAALARRAGATHVIDVACGRARKLVALQPEFETVGLDFGANLDYCRSHHAEGTWVEVNLECPWAGLVPADAVRNAVVVCSDVIEHLVNPTELLRGLAEISLRSRAVLLSTPERTRTWGPGHMGPPPNPAHIREWSLDELVELARHHGIALVFAGLTASEDATYAPKTSLLVAVPPDTPPDEARALGQFCRDELQSLRTTALQARRQLMTSALTPASR